MFEGFVEETLDVAGQRLLVRHGGSGPAVLLLHGHPRTSATWHRVAPLLVDAGFTVVAPDLRGYGRSAKPVPDAEHRVYSKRSTANDLAGLMTRLGRPDFSVVGHDRGAYVALRLALDHPDRVTRLTVLDAVPISEALARADSRFAERWWHWFFFAQPSVPERVITADPVAWYGPRLDPVAMGVENRAEVVAAVSDPRTVTAMLEDYRAGLTVDRADEEADRAAGRRVECPLLVLWATRDDMEDLYGDPLEVWSAWAADRRGTAIDSGHHIAEEAPAALVAELRSFLTPAEARA